MASLVKRGNVYHIRWSIMANGTIQQRSESCRGLKYPEVLARKREIENRLAKGLPVDLPSGGDTQAFYTAFLEHIDGTVAQTTQAMYAQTIAKHILPHLDPDLGRVGITDVQRCRRAWKHLAPKTQRNFLFLLHRFLQLAVKWRLLEHNPVDCDDAPRVEKKRLVLPVPEDVRAVLRELRGSIYYLPTLLCFATGMRRGEVIGLKWGDVDTQAGTLTVQETVCYYTETIYKDTKNRKVNVISIGPTVCRLLERHARRVPSTALRAYVCVTEEGNHLQPVQFSKAVIEAAARVGVHLSPHKLRHLQATELLASGVPMKSVSARLNHSSITITNDRYGHLTKRMDDQIVAASEEILHRKTREKK